MSSLRRAPALLVILAVLAVPATGTAIAASSKLTPQAPTWLTQTAQSATSPTPTPTPTTATSTSTGAGASTTPSPSVPRTGFDVLPEAILGAGLLCAGGILRRRRA